MKVGDRHLRTIWPTVGTNGARAFAVIDQRQLPHALVTLTIETPEAAATAIESMTVRGAPLIGATAAYGMALAAARNPEREHLLNAHARLLATRPTAVNLRWALDDMMGRLDAVLASQRAEVAWARAATICDDDVAACRAIGQHGLELLLALASRRREPVTAARPLQVLTHCNAGWLATVDWGTALAPIYAATERGLPVHVWVDETRPRNQGASLTAWELGAAGVPHTLVVDNAGGHMMQHGLVDAVIVGSDRTTARGDVCNKIGTYLKALAARAHDVPFYAAVPGSSIDFRLDDGVAEIPIEERDAREVTEITGVLPSGEVTTVRLTPAGSPARNWGFDVTPAALVTAVITERGVCAATREGLRALFPHEAV